jgi:hypothetical protein
MRTILTIDEDIADKLKAEAKRTGKAFREVVNEYLRLGIDGPKRQRPESRFRVKTRDLGRLRPGLTLDNVGKLLERAEGPVHR